VSLPLGPPIKPQLALTRKELPRGEEWAYEPKLDGFRAIVFVDGDDFYVQSRSGKELRRYFSELAFAPGRWVLDGELVIRDADGNLEFDALQERIHPAQSRIELLSKEIPVEYIVFDLLAEGDEALLETPLAERRQRLEAIAELTGLELTPLTPDSAAARISLFTLLSLKSCSASDMRGVLQRVLVHPCPSGIKRHICAKSQIPPAHQWLIDKFNLSNTA